MAKGTDHTTISDDAWKGVHIIRNIHRRIEYEKVIALQHLTYSEAAQKLGIGYNRLVRYANYHGLQFRREKLREK